MNGHTDERIDGGGNNFKNPQDQPRKRPPKKQKTKQKKDLELNVFQEM